ncbi:MAG: SAM-dependent rRNA m(5)C967 methyltransferase [Pseudomonadota bacterium]|jgi:16S rRNA (cytosine967-C5)-methyltransferase
MSLNLRAHATRLLGQIIFEGHSLSALLTEYKKACEQPKDASFLQSLVFGTLRHYFLLKQLYLPLLKNPLPEKDQICYPLICVGLYQLKFMRVPHHAVLSETVEAARVLGKHRLTGLINAVLRNYLRQQDRLEATALCTTEAKYNHPHWMIRRIKTAWPEQWESILLANNTHPPLSLRVNTRCITVNEYLDTLSLAGIDATPSQHLLPSITLNTASDVRELPGFRSGCFYAQDVAAQAAPTLLDLHPGQRVLDMCAAPGGKTTHIAELEPKLAALVAVDNSPDRCARINENLKRLQHHATVIVGDACTPNTWWDGQLFDRILVDAPCSATGVIRRHPDIKLLRRDADIATLAQQQSDMLAAVWPLLKTGGILVYTTCSILPDENERVVSRFMKTHHDARIFPFEMSVGIPRTIGHQVLPGQDNQDGFYYARLQKAS